jgi:predicted DNA-binding transcriptional regulator AlpA
MPVPPYQNRNDRRIALMNSRVETLLSEAEVLTILGLKSRKVLWQLRRAGKLRFVRLGGRTVRYRQCDVQALIDAGARRRA